MFFVPRALPQNFLPLSKRSLTLTLTQVTFNPDPKSAGLDVLGQQVLGQHVGHRWVNVNNTKARAKKGWFLSTESHFDKQIAEGATIRSNGLENNEHQALGEVECEDGSY